MDDSEKNSLPGRKVFLASSLESTLAELSLLLESRLSDETANRFPLTSVDHRIMVPYVWAPQHIWQFTPAPVKETPIIAIQTVAKTIWVLWANDVERVWALLLKWIVATPVQKQACKEIIEVGFVGYHFSPEDAFRKIEGWLVAESENVDLDAATSLIEFVLPAMSKDALSDLALNLKMERLDKSLKGFSAAMKHIFNRDPTWTLRLFYQWLRKGERVYNDLVAVTLREIARTGEPLDYSLPLEKQLMALRASSHEKQVVSEIQRLIKKMRDGRSKAKNRAARSDSLSRGPFSAFD